MVSDVVYNLYCCWWIAARVSYFSCCESSLTSFYTRNLCGNSKEHILHVQCYLRPTEISV